MIDVVAAVLRGSNGSVVLAQRCAPRSFAGCWEFPGGKLEPGEDPDQGLARELREELGIDVPVPDGGFPRLICVEHSGPSVRLRLDVREVATWRGEPHGLEGQPVRTFKPAELATLPMPPADRPVVAALLDPPLYAISPPASDPTELDAWLHRQLSQSDRRLSVRSGEPPESDPDQRHSRFQYQLADGNRRLLLRPGAPLASDPVAMRRLATRAAKAARDAKVELLLSRHIELAALLGLGVHLSAAQLVESELEVSLAHARSVGVGAVAASTHNAHELALAERLGCDFACMSPIRATTSHPEAKTLGWTGFTQARAAALLPVYALGGLGPTDLAEARAHGAQGAAGIRAFCRN